MILKNLLKSSLDNYVLPGTLTGSEILWLYLIHWKRDVWLVASASVAVIVARCEFMKLERVLGRAAE